MIEFLREKFRENLEADALALGDSTESYAGLERALDEWIARLEEKEIEPGAVVALEADFSLEAVAALLALVERRCIVVPLSSTIGAQRTEFLEVAAAQHVVSLVGGTRTGAAEAPAIASLRGQGGHSLYDELRRRDHPGLVLFSSGSTGKSKAALHDFSHLLDKFRVARHRLRSIAFLLFDHIGGVNTLFYALSNGGCVIAVPDRNPESVCEAIERHRAELLPASPTFLNLLLASEAYRRHDLSSLRTITYGTEAMPPGTLERLNRIFPDVRLQQTYGLSEVGILRSKSKSNDSLWVRIGGEGFETRVVDGVLEIKAHSAMLGYLNAPSPFTEDGWFNTGDAVEVDGEYFRFLGRTSDLINVGGEKVYPAEVESVLEEMPGVDECVVSGQKNPIVGQIVMARVKLSTEESTDEFVSRMWEYCGERLQRFKIPQKVAISHEAVHSGRFKKLRRTPHASNAV